MKLSDYVINFIAGQGVSHIFEFIGGATTHLVDSTCDRKDIRCVPVHHEQAGAFAAEAYARINGRLGVAMATSGPGALNLMTGIGSCYFDSVPCLFITGQVNTYEYKFGRPIRQLGFQETDIVSIANPITKYAVLVANADLIRFHLEKAVYIARHRRPGPVLIDIPMNVQRADIDPATLISFHDSDEYNLLKRPLVCDDRQIKEVASLIRKAKRPVILVGGGVRAADGVEELNKFITSSGIPCVTSLMGLDAIPHYPSVFWGMIGAYGNRYSNLILANCDLLIILGSRLDSRQTGTQPETFARAAKKIHVDIDEGELNLKVQADVSIHCDVKDFLIALNGEMAQYQKADISGWYGVINKYRDAYPTIKTCPDDQTIDPNLFMRILSSHCKKGEIICTDVGQNQMWAAQSFCLKEDQRMLISGGMGAMGFALPAALGAAKAAEGRRVVVICGDGGIQINIQEFDTIVRHKLPVVIFVMNNGCLGMVRQFQEMYFDGRLQSTVIGYSCPNIGEIAKAYGLIVFTIASPKESEPVIRQALAAGGPVLVDVKLPQHTVVNPKLVVNRPIEDMSPHLDREELEKIMLIRPDEG